MKPVLSVWIVLVAVGLGTSLSAAEESATDSPTAIAAAYFKAMDAANLDAAEKLFASESEVFESGGQERSWQHYRKHHLGPEIAEVESFATTLGEPVERISQDGTLAYMAWPLEYKIVLGDARVIESKGTVTFVMVREEDELRITHLHWSSRRKR